MLYCSFNVCFIVNDVDLLVEHIGRGWLKLTFHFTYAIIQDSVNYLW